MTISLDQPSLSRGEVGPEVAARTDIQGYMNGLSKCINFIVSPYGGVVNRPGTMFIEQTPGNEVARLIRFKFNAADTYALEFTHLKMRVYRNGAIVLTGLFVPFELVTPYTRDQIFDINFTQSADVMDMVHPDHKPKKLRRFGHANWTLTDVSLVPSIAAPAGLAGVAGSPGSINYRYVVTAVKDDESMEESLQSNTALVASDLLSSTAAISLSWSAVPGALNYNIYKDDISSGVFGFIGRSTTTTFNDRGITAVKTDTPPTGADPFVGAGNFPSAVAYFQQRLCYGATNNRPQTLWFSKTGAFQNFGNSIPLKDDDAIVWTLSSNEVNRLKHLVSLRSLMAFTDGAEWLIQGQASGFTSKTINGAPQTYNGIGGLRPLVLNDTVLYAQERGRSVTAFGYSLSSDGFTGTDISILSPQMLRDYGLVDWDYQKIPYSVVWGAREDGRMIGVTYLQEQEVIGWHRHVTDGLVLSVCSVPEDRGDSVYLCVERTVGGLPKRYIERMESRQHTRYNGLPMVRFSFFVDCGLTYTGQNTTSETMTITGGSEWKYPESLTLTSSNPARFVIGDVGDHVQYYETPASDPIAMEITGFTSGAVVTVRPIGVVPEAIRGVPFDTWTIARDSIGGLGHLEGLEVVILADGNVVRGRTIVGGSISPVLDTPAGIVHVGLGYESELETLEVNIPNSETLKDKRIMVKSVTAILLESRGGWYGRSNSPNDLWEFKQRQDSDDYESMDLMTGRATQQLTDSWLGSGKITIVQKDPLPMQILSIIPQIEVGGRL